MRMPTRSRLIRLALMTVACGWVAPGCKSKPAESPADEEPAAPEEPSFVVGIVYSGPRDDGGFNQAHAAGAAALRTLPGVKVVEEENVPDGADAALTLDKLATLQGASVVFATGLRQFDPAAIDQAKKHPKVAFVHCGGRYQEGLHPMNAGSYYGYYDEAFYVSGVVAAMATKTKKLGFIAGKPVPHAVRSVNAFTLGARSVNPKITTTVVFTGAWSDAVAETNAANSLVDQKVDVLATFVNAPKTILEIADRRSIYSIGVHTDGAKHAPKGYLTGVEANWGKIYTDYVAWVREGKTFPRIVRGGFKEGVVALSPFGPAVPKEAREKAAELKAQLAAGELVILKGPIKDNQKRPILAAGQEITQRDIRLEVGGNLVEGIIGTLGD